MFDVGYAEVFFLILVGVIVLGPERLPAVAKTLANFTRRARRMAQEFQHELEKEVDLQEIKKIQAEFTDATDPLKAEFTEATKPLREAADTLAEGNSILDRSAKSLVAGTGIAAVDADSQSGASEPLSDDSATHNKSVEHANENHIDGSDHSHVDDLNHDSDQLVANELDHGIDSSHSDNHHHAGENSDGDHSVAGHPKSTNQSAFTSPEIDATETPDSKTSPS